MADQRKLIAQLAVSRKVLAANEAVAAEVAAFAKRVDPNGEFKVSTRSLVVNGLRRSVAVVTNTAEDAAASEYGTRDRHALRPLGRASSAHKG